MPGPVILSTWEKLKAYKDTNVESCPHLQLLNAKNVFQRAVWSGMRSHYFRERLTRSEKGLVVLRNSVGSESEASSVFQQGPQLEYGPANILAPGWAIWFDVGNTGFDDTYNIGPVHVVEDIGNQTHRQKTQLEAQFPH